MQDHQKIPPETELGLAQGEDVAQQKMLRFACKEKMEQAHDSTGGQLGKNVVSGAFKELCIYSFWHVNAQCLVQFQFMKGADATLDLFLSLTAQKAQMFFFSEFGCLPSEESF